MINGVSGLNYITELRRWGLVSSLTPSISLIRPTQFSRGGADGTPSEQRSYLRNPVRWRTLAIAKLSPSQIILPTSHDLEVMA